MDEDSAPEPVPDDESGDGSGGVPAPGRHRPRRRAQWTMTGSTPRRGLLARLWDLLRGRASLCRAGAAA